MKFHWGHGVIVALASFMVFILVLFFNIGDTGSLVTENYYEKELTLDQDIKSETRANNLKVKPEFIVQANGFLLRFPESTSEDLKGEVFLLRSANEKQDIKMPLKLNNRKELLIPENVLAKGPYEMSLIWEENGLKYLMKNTLIWKEP